MSAETNGLREVRAGIPNHIPAVITQPTTRNTRIEGTRERFKLYGDLTLRGTTREVVFDAEFQGTGANPWGKQVAGFSASGELNRKDFGLTWNVALESGGVLVSEKVTISIDGQVFQPAQVPAEAGAATA